MVTAARSVAAQPAQEGQVETMVRTTNASYVAASTSVKLRADARMFAIAAAAHVDQGAHFI